MRGDARAQIGIEKELHEGAAQHDVEQGGDGDARGGIHHPHEHALFDAAVFARAVILPRIRRHGGAERRKRLRGDAVDFGGGGVRRHHAGKGRVQPVERRLLHHAADGGDGELQRHGKPLREVHARKACVPPKVRPAGAQKGVAL